MEEKNIYSKTKINIFFLKKKKFRALSHGSSKSSSQVSSAVSSAASPKRRRPSSARSKGQRPRGMETFRNARSKSGKIEMFEKQLCSSFRMKMLFQVFPCDLPSFVFLKKVEMFGPPRRDHVERKQFSEGSSEVTQEVGRRRRFWSVRINGCGKPGDS